MSQLQILMVLKIDASKQNDLFFLFLILRL